VSRREPTLGWTVDGFVGTGTELEFAVGPRPPQNRTQLDQATVKVEQAPYASFLRGLTPDQQAKMRDRRRGQDGGGVIIR
jgi:hypothetical protein